MEKFKKKFLRLELELHSKKFWIFANLKNIKKFIKNN